MVERLVADICGWSFLGMVLVSLFVYPIAQYYGAFAWWMVLASIATLAGCAVIGGVVGLWFAWWESKFGGYDV